MPQNKDGNGGGGGGLSIASYFRSAEEGSVVRAPRGPLPIEEEEDWKRMGEGTKSVLFWGGDRSRLARSLGRSAGRSVAFSATAAAAAGSNLDKNSSGAAVSSDCSSGAAGEGSRRHQIQMAANYFGNVPYCES